MHKIPFPKQSTKKTSRPLELIHSDLCGPMNVESIGGSKYVLTFTDDYTRYVTVYFLKSKSEVLSKFEEYVNMVENMTGQKVQNLRTDNGGEYVSDDFTKFCTSKGIFHQFTNLYTPEQNGTSERLNRTLVEKAMSMIFHAKMPLNFWAEAVNTAVYLHNRSPTSSLKDTTPFEYWFGKKPNVSNLKVFGCICFVHTSGSLRQKLDPKARKTIFVGYPSDTKGYKMYDLESKRFVRSRNVIFHESKFHSFKSVDEEAVLKEDSEISERSDEDGQFTVIQIDPTISEHTEDTQEVGATYEENFMRQVEDLGTTRKRKTPERFRPDECHITENEEPQTVKEALKQSDKWKQSLEAEYNSLMNNETWELVPPPEGSNIVGSKWVLKACWNQTLDSFLKKNGYRKSGADNCIYVKSERKANGVISFVILAVYVDDIIPVSNDVDMLHAEKESLCGEFEMVDQGEIHFVLGMSIKRDRTNKVLFINQAKYVESVLNRFRMQDCKSVSTPLEVGTTFHKRTDNEEPFDKHEYQQTIGCLTYLSTATRPDIAAAVSILSAFMSNLSKKHWAGIKRILRYVKGTLNHGLKFTGNGDDRELYGYSDANWAGDVDTTRSVSGYVFKVANSTISWCSKKQATVAKSTTEAEYVSLSHASQEAIWMRRLLCDIGCKTDQPTLLYEDNQGAIEISKHPKFHNRTKHIDITFHFIRERISSNEIKVVYCPSDDMLADIMTKGLPKERFEKLRNMLNVCSC